MTLAVLCGTRLGSNQRSFRGAPGNRGIFQGFFIHLLDSLALGEGPISVTIIIGMSGEEERPRQISQSVWRWLQLRG